MRNKLFTVVSIEDNEPDFELLKKALEAVSDINIDLINIKNGNNAIDFLYKKNKYASAPTPNVIILDINLPQINGHEILRSIKKDPYLKVIPVIIFSTSDSEKDIKESYSLYANSYITKTFNIKELFKKIAIMADYWLKTSELPPIINYYSVENLKKPNKKGENNENSSDR